MKRSESDSMLPQLVEHVAVFHLRYQNLSELSMRL